MAFSQVVLKLLGALLLFSIAEGQLQAAWKFSKEGNTDNQAFVSINGHSLSIHPVLGQLFRGASSIGDFLGLVHAAQVHRAREPVGGGGTPAPFFTSAPASNDTVLQPSLVQDDKPVPGAVDVGDDGFLYFLSNETFDTLPGCQNYCHRFRGFGLAIARTNVTMSQLKKYSTVQVNMAIQRKPDGIKFVWGDGSEVDQSLLLPNEPILNNGARSDRVALYAHGSNVFLDDAERGYGSHKTKCLCQGFFGTSGN